MSGQIKAICWDIDGVLVDTEPLHKDKLFAVAAHHGIKLTKKDWSQLQGIGDKRAWEWLEENHGLTISQDEFLEECEEYYMAHPEKIIPRPGSRDVFDYFASLNLPQGAVSSGSKEQVTTNLAIAGVDTRVLFKVNADDVLMTKPDPEPYLLGKYRLCKALGWDVRAEDSRWFLAIEDSITGVRAAKHAGMTAILWSQTRGKTCPEADYVVYTKKDLMKLCRKLTAKKDPPSAPRPKKGQPKP